MNLREWALPVYTVMIQLAAGALLVLWTLRGRGLAHLGRAGLDAMVRRPLLIIVLTIYAGMIGSHFHLSRPYLSFLAVSNIESSWLSREIAFTVLFSLSATACWYLQWFVAERQALKTILGWFAVAMGYGTLYCMSRAYQLPVQAAWNAPATFGAFLGTSLLLGSMSMAAILLIDLRFSQVWERVESEAHSSFIRRALIWLAGMAAVTAAAIVALNRLQIVALPLEIESARASLDLLLNLYRPLLIIRLVALATGAIGLLACVALLIRRRSALLDLVAPVYVACLIAMIGEILGRFLFYATHVRVGI